MKNKVLLFALAAWLPIFGWSQHSAQFFVSTYGNDANVGSIQKPFATPGKAKDAALAYKSAHPNDSVHIYFRKGTYELKSSLRFDSLKKGNSQNIPFIISAYHGETVSISGGIVVPAKAARPVNDEKVLGRLVPEARNHVVQVDLKTLGITNYGTIRTKGFGRPYTPSAMELFCNNEPMQLSRWPNDSLVAIGKVLDPGSIPRNGDQSHRGGTFKYNSDRPKRWTEAKDFWISGLFHYGYADDAVGVAKLDTAAKTLTTRQETMYGFESGKSFQQWYAFNLLEEIDRPGEYYIDRSTGILYFYPPQGQLKGIELSILETPLVVLENSSDVIFKGITFEYGRGIGIYIEGGEADRIENCTIRNMGGVGVCIGKGTKPEEELWHQGAFEPASETLGNLDSYLYANTVFNRNAGTNHVITNCRIYNTGSGGVSMGGGDRLTLESGNNQVVNCTIHDFNRIDRSYKAGVNIDGVGNIIRNCEIFHCPGSAIYLHGNNHLIELNNIHDAVLDGDDMGAVYYGRNPSEFGNKVINNFFHDIGNKNGIIAAVYHDDGACGMEVTGNVFYKAGSMTVLIGGGNDNVYKNNIFIDCTLAFHLDNRLMNWAKNLVQPGALFEQRLDTVRYKQPPYSTAYPNLVTYFQDSVGFPKRNVIENNVFVKVKTMHSGKAEWAQVGKNFITTEDPGFQEEKKQNFNLNANSEIFRQLPDFKPIPFDKIGPQK